MELPASRDKHQKGLIAVKKNLALAAAMSIMTTTTVFPLTLNAATPNSINGVALTPDGKLDVETEYIPYSTAYGVRPGKDTDQEPSKPFNPGLDSDWVYTMYGIPGPEYPFGVKVIKDKIVIKEGETCSISDAVKASVNCKYKVTSEGIITIDDEGIITGIKKGNTSVKIYVSLGTRTDIDHYESWTNIDHYKSEAAEIQVEVIEATADTPQPEQTDLVTVTRDKDLITLYNLSGETDENKVVAPNEKVRIVAKAFTDKKLTGFRINDKTVHVPNDYEYTLPASGSVSIAPVYEDIIQNEGYFSSISTHDSENTNIAVNSDEVSLFVDNKETYGGTVLNKKENKRLYFSINEDSSRGKIKSVRYNGQRIKPRGYFFINIDENSFDNVVIDIEYE